MNSTLNSAWLIVFIGVAVALVWAYYFYKNNDEITPRVKMLLAFLRFSSLTILSFLALGIWLKTFDKQTYPKKIAVALDASNSMQFEKDSAALQKLIQEIIIQESDQIDIWQFGASATLVDDSIDFNQKTTNLEALLQQVQNVYPEGQLAKMILVSDGIMNRGRAIQGFDQLGFTIDAVGVGDTSDYPDAIAKNLFHNSKTFKGNETPLEVQLQFQDLAGKQYQYEIQAGDSIKVKGKGKVEGNSFFVKYQHRIRFHKEGQIALQLSVKIDEKEVVSSNNTLNSTIEVKEEQKKVAILYASPTPNISAIRNVLKHTNDYSTDLFQYKDLKEEELAGYDILMLLQLDKLPNTFWKWQEKAQKGLVLFTNGTGTPTISNSMLRITPSRSVLEVKPKIPEASNFLDIKTEAIDNLPVVQLMRGNIQISDGQQTVLEATSNGINLETPLIVMGNSGKTKLVVINAMDTWRWKLYEGIDEQKENLFFSDVLMKLVNFAGLTKAENRLQVDIPKTIDDTRPLVVRASVLDISYKVDPLAKVNILLQNGSEKIGKGFYYANQRYSVDLGRLSPGDYQYRVEAISGNDTLIKEGSLKVEEQLIETMNRKADWVSLSQLAKQNGGEFVPLKSAHQFIQSRAKVPLTRIEYIQEEVKLIFEWKWIVYLLLALLTAEWSIRKYNGIR